MTVFFPGRDIERPSPARNNPLANVSSVHTSTLVTTAGRMNRVAVARVAIDSELVDRQ